MDATSQNVESAPAAAAAPAADSPGVEVRGGDAGQYTATTAPAAVPAGEAAPQRQPGGLFDGSMLWILLLVFVAFTLFGGRGRKAQKAEMERLKTLKKGDRIVTIGLMHGTVTALTDDTMTIKTDEQGNTLVFERRALHKILPRPGEPEEAK